MLMNNRPTSRGPGTPVIPYFRDPGCSILDYPTPTDLSVKGAHDVLCRVLELPMVRITTKTLDLQACLGAGQATFQIRFDLQLPSAATLSDFLSWVVPKWVLLRAAINPCQY